MQHPGSDPDVVVRMSTPTLARVFSGAERWATAVANGDLEVSGPPTLTKKLPTWFLWSPWAEQTQAKARQVARR